MLGLYGYMIIIIVYMELKQECHIIRQLKN